MQSIQQKYRSIHTQAQSAAVPVLVDWLKKVFSLQHVIAEALIEALAQDITEESNIPVHGAKLSARKLSAQIECLSPSASVSCP